MFHKMSHKFLNCNAILSAISTILSVVDSNDAFVCLLSGKGEGPRIFVKVCHGFKSWPKGSDLQTSSHRITWNGFCCHIVYLSSNIKRTWKRQLCVFFFPKDLVQNDITGMNNVCLNTRFHMENLSTNAINADFQNSNCKHCNFRMYH